MSQTPKKILVIDDDPGVRKLICSVLEREGYASEAMDHLATAITQGFSGGYDLITLDLHMPGIDGKDVARALARRKVATPVVVVSAHADDEAVEKLKAAGVVYFVSKPFSAEELLKAVRRVLGESTDKGRSTD